MLRTCIIAAAFAASLAPAAAQTCIDNEIDPESSAIAYDGDIEYVDRAFETADGRKVWRVSDDNLARLGEFFSTLTPAWRTPSGIWSRSGVKAVIRTDAGDCHIVADTEDLYVLRGQDTGYIVTKLNYSTARELRDLLARPAVETSE